MRLPGPWFLVIVLLILLMALYLRLAPLSSESVDGDELFSLRVASSDPAQALRLIREDLVHPPLYYLLLKATLPKGRPASAGDIRVLSLAAGAASLVVVLLIGFAAPPLRNPAILAAALLALNKTHIFYSQQARSYALFCALVGVLLVWGLLRDRYGHQPGYWMAGTALMTAVLYTHYFGAFYCLAIVAPVFFSHCPRRLKLRAAASVAFACAAFLPWVCQEAAVYRQKSGLLSNLGWEELPTLFTLKMLFADYFGIPYFRGATSLAFLIGAGLVCCALLPSSRKEQGEVDSRTRASLALTALGPPLLAFLLTRWPFQLPIFGGRHLLPSILPALILAAYGLWRTALRTPKPLCVLAPGAILLCAFQALPVWSDWPGPSRQPYAAIATWLKRSYPGHPIYTTYPYGIGEPVAFYLEGRRRVDPLPAGTAGMPEEWIVLYRPAVTKEDAAVRPLLDRFDILEQHYYSARHSRWGTRLLVLRKPPGDRDR